ncbi:diacylglycerol kinase [Pontibacter flavimaris]|uniref:Diacylglycerol kinase n=1 Tax=Pontibacter flavimaris TaxID=1797110 RepID=A0A1Q5PF35_9BACT|nr:diacylglycerol kinase family protein [Pontibacter flavimaris]OKL40834.1 diacylglycerol kinase [Pontibacter flavimaris]
MRAYLKKRFNSFRFAFRGISAAVRSEPHMRLHVLAAIAVVVVGYTFDVTKTEWCLLVGSMGLVVTAEIINTAIETVVNLVSPDFNQLAGRAKDLAAGAVLVAAITAALIGAIIFLPYLLALAKVYF